MSTLLDSLDIALSSLSFLSLREKSILKKNIDSLDRIAVLSIGDIEKMIQRTVKNHDWNPAELIRSVRQALLVMEKMSLRAVRFDQEEYPPLLREINDAPYLLFYRGNIGALMKKCVSVVGTRRACADCAAAARSFAGQACGAGVTVVSGLAYGIDSWAHRGALEACAKGAPGTTVAVLPSGIDNVQPSGNKRLAASVLKNGGALVSEYMPGVFAEKWRFVQRDRLIAALSAGTVVVQAPAASGALITADFALDYNRDVAVHKAAFCSQAQETDRLKVMGMELSDSRKERTVQKFVEDGAPVISSFEEFVQVSSQAPGTHTDIKNKGQLELF